MSRPILLLAALLAAGTTAPAAAVAEPAPFAPYVEFGEDPAGEDDPLLGEDGVEEQDPNEEEDPAELAELCGQGEEDDPEGSEDEDLGLVEELAEAGEELAEDPGVSTLEPAGEDEGEELEEDPFDLEELCAELAAEAAAEAAAAVPTVRKVLKSGKLATGMVTVSGPGVVRQELWLPAPSSARGVRAVGGKGKVAAKKSRAAKSSGGRILAGKATKVVTRKGEVKLTVQLTGAARKALRAAKRDVRFTVKTTTKARGGKAEKTKISSLMVKWDSRPSRSLAPPDGPEV